MGDINTPKIKIKYCHIYIGIESLQKLEHEDFQTIFEIAKPIKTTMPKSTKREKKVSAPEPKTLARNDLPEPEDGEILLDNTSKNLETDKEPVASIITVWDGETFSKIMDFSDKEKDFIKRLPRVQAPLFTRSKGKLESLIYKHLLVTVPLKGN